MGQTKIKTTDTNGSRLDRIDTFVIAGVVTVLAIRGFLSVAGYPQIGNDSLHIAHVLYGGIILMVAFLLLLLSDRPNKLLAALLGGVGFGFFIDEVGKFVTQDNDYFYEPAVLIMYVIFLLIWFISRLIIVRGEKTPFLSPAEWPAHRVLELLIIAWMLVQFAAAICLGVFVSVVGLTDVSAIFGIARPGLLAAAVHSYLIGTGLFYYWKHKHIQAAHTFRGATLFAIVALYPFIYYDYPVLASIGVAITLLVILGLSEASLKGIFKKLLIQR